MVDIGKGTQAFLAVPEFPVATLEMQLAQLNEADVLARRFNEHPESRIVRWGPYGDASKCSGLPAGAAVWHLIFNAGNRTVSLGSAEDAARYSSWLGWRVQKASVKVLTISAAGQSWGTGAAKWAK